jgi:carboxypeptidase C (cathepsin A)
MLIDSRNYQPVLEEIMRHNITTLIWAGDTDWICNWKANLYTAENLMHPAKPQFLAEKMVPYKVNGKTMGEYKTAGKLSFLRVYGAGHTVMSYRESL